jgi:hypothetical protein
MPRQASLLQSCTAANQASAAYELHLLYRLAAESPEQLEPIVRRAALRSARRRIGRRLWEYLLAAGKILEPYARQRAASQT